MKGLVSFFLVLPVLIKTLSNYNPEFFNFELWLHFVMLRMGHHIFPSMWDLRNYILFSILVAFFFLSLRYRPIRKYNRTVLFIGLATLILLVLGTVFTEIYPKAEIIRLSLFRSLIYFRVIMIIYVSNYIYCSLKKSFENYRSV